MLRDDYDGEGTPAPGPVLVDAAGRRAEWLKSHGVPAPSGTLASVNGAVVFEWYPAPGYYCDFEVTGPEEFECLWMGPDRAVPTERVETPHRLRQLLAAAGCGP